MPHTWDMATLNSGSSSIYSNLFHNFFFHSFFPPILFVLDVSLVLLPPLATSMKAAAATRLHLWKVHFSFPFLPRGRECGMLINSFAPLMGAQTLTYVQTYHYLATKTMNERGKWQVTKSLCMFMYFFNSHLSSLVKYSFFNLFVALLITTWRFLRLY